MAASPSMDARPARASPRGILAAVALLALHAGLVLHQASVQSTTYDEPYYAPAGWARLVAGANLNPEHPPAVKAWLGASWLGAGLPDPRDVPGFAAKDQWTFGPRLLYRDPARAPALLLRARASVVLLSLLLGVGVLLAARRAFGGAAGLLALALHVLDPLVVAHAGLATLDLGAAAAIFGAVALSWVALDAGGWRLVLAAGAATGLALAAKGTGVVVLPVLLLLALAPLLGRGGPRPGELRLRLGRATAVAAGGAVALAVACLPDGPDAFFRALAAQRAHAAAGHASWAKGIQAMQCPGWYFPFAWIVKTPLALLAATAAGVGVVASRARSAPATAVMVLATPAIVGAAALVSGICNGVRQLLPVTPFLAVAGGAALAALWRGRAGRWATAGLLSWAAAALLLVHPHAITYANEAAGGPSRTWTLLTDSNVDWGQALPDLARVVGDVPVRTLWIDYFGTAWPPAHGVDRFRKIQDWRFSAGAVLPWPRRDGQEPAGRELVAVSATCLVDAYVAESDLHAWLRARTPWRWAGNSIAVFDVTGDAVAHRELARMAERMRDPITAREALERAREIEAAGKGDAR
jgi:4-amino-4-deoxy-L-arabinose transferase-like glycosyltransferase